MKIIKSVAIDITRKCTLKCRHCYNYSSEFINCELADLELMTLLNELLLIEPERFCLCGGEPLLRKKIIFDFIKQIQNSKIDTELNLVSNGELITEQLAEEIIKSNISSIQISLDGANTETHNWLRDKKGAYERAIKAIGFLDKNRLLYNKDFVISVAFCVNKMNFHEITKAIELCENLNVKIFRIQPIMLLGRASKFLKEYALCRDELQQISDIIVKRRRDNILKSKMLIEWVDPWAQVLSETVENSVYVNEKGELLLNPYIPIAVGSLKRNNMHEYLIAEYEKKWNEPLFEYLRNYMIKSGNMNLNELNVMIPEIGKGTLYFDVLDENCRLMMDYTLKKIKLKIGSNN